MGSETIAVLELMTSGIKSVITHPTMTDRLAAMLNYFLKTLTGPDRKNFKVRKFCYTGCLFKFLMVFDLQQFFYYRRYGVLYDNNASRGSSNFTCLKT